MAKRGNEKERKNYWVQDTTSHLRTLALIFVATLWCHILRLTSQSVVDSIKHVFKLNIVLGLYIIN